MFGGLRVVVKESTMLFPLKLKSVFTLKRLVVILNKSVVEKLLHPIYYGYKSLNKHIK